MVDRLFELAYTIMARLPTVPDPDSWYPLVDVSTPARRAAWKDAGDSLLRIAAEAPEEKKFYFRYWAGDVFIGLGELERALEIKPRPPIGGRRSVQTDDIMSLKLAVGQLTTGEDIACLFGPKLTRYGLENLEAVVRFLDVRVALLQENENRNLLEEWKRDAYLHPTGGTSLFTGAPAVLVKYPPSYSFSRSPTAEASCAEVMREAENTLREERDLPRVGEGWIGETALYYEVRNAFPHDTVLQHARPPWLGRQHLDIYLPDGGIALEYQGAHHDRPVEFFGGEEAYRRTVARDRRKLGRCRRNGVRIIYVRPGYVLADVLVDIRRGAT